jgi:hypothetical protein
MRFGKAGAAGEDQLKIFVLNSSDAADDLNDQSVLLDEGGIDRFKQRNLLNKGWLRGRVQN